MACLLLLLGSMSLNLHIPRKRGQETLSLPDGFVNAPQASFCQTFLQDRRLSIFCSSPVFALAHLLR